MSWRTVVISSSSKLDYQMGFLVVRNKEVLKVNVSEIETLIIESTAVSISAALLSELSKAKVKVIFCDEKRNPSSELVSYYGSHDSSNKIRMQMAWDFEMKKSVWTAIVTEKIKKQSQLLEFYNNDATALLNTYINQVELYDATNREGHAAKVYFNSLFGKDFTRTDDSSINAALNYGYAIILSSFNRCITANGYITQIGLFHDNMFNHFNLASDMMEPFRPLVDRRVFELNPQKFEHDEKMEMLKVLQDNVVISGRKEYVNNAIKMYCKSVFDAINECDISLIKFYEYEL